jgi:steroid 5-alpha reductase family enzyme
MGAGLGRVVRDGLGLQVVAWCLAAPLQTERFYDLTGSLTFMWLTLSSLAGKARPTTRNYVNSALVVTWAARLGSFLVARIQRDGGVDRRFDKVREQPLRFLVFWLIQGVWTVLTALPVYVINTQRQDPEGAERVTLRDVLGWSLWLAGFALQVTADRQKSVFRAEPANRHRFITTGVWAWCQHPNYAGEIAMWSSLWLACSSQLEGLALLTVCCPLFNYYLLRHVSGVPLLRKLAERSWGKDPLWLEYVAKTNLLVPNPLAQPVGAKAK